jgi:integrase
VAADNAAAAPPALRAHLSATLRPGADVRAGDPTERWLGRWCLRLGQLDRARLAVVDQQLGVGDNGQPLSAWTASRYRKVSRACIRRAVELDVLPADPWPPAPRGRARRKAVRTRKAVDVRALPDPSTMAKALAAIVTHQPASRMYQAMTAVAYYAGLRPSEVVMLRASCVDLPPTGWGTIEVREADISFDQPGEPKDRATVGADTSPTRSRAASLARRAGSRQGRFALPHPLGRPTLGIELGTGVEACAAGSRPRSAAGLRLSPRRGHHLAASSGATGRGCGTHGPQCRDTRLHLRWRSRGRQSYR